MKLTRAAFYFAFLLATIASLPYASGAKKCGTWATEDCIGDTDIRYDPDASTDLLDLHPLYKGFEGLWIGNFTTYDSMKVPASPGQVPPGPGGRGANPYPGENILAFWNVTVSGSRFYQHDLYVYSPADEDFCAEELPEGFKNVQDDGECGVNGYASAGEVFRTSTHEIDEISVNIKGTGS